MNSSVNKAFVCIICLVMFVFITAFSGNSLLESPKTLGVTFAHTLAGFGCWTKVDEAYQDLINIEKAGEILDQLEEVGDNYLYGWINFQILSIYDRKLLRSIPCTTPLEHIF